MIGIVNEIGSRSKVVDGNVGIGTASPSYPLEVEHVSAPTVKIESSAANVSPRLIIDAGGGSGTADPHIKFDADGVDWSIGTDQDDSDKFMIAASSGLGSPKVTILTNGNVGVGTSAINNKFQVNGGSAALASGSAIMGIYSTDGYAADKGGSLLFQAKYNSGGSYASTGFIGGFKENGTNENTAGYLVFGTRPDGLAVAERMRIASGGAITGAGGFSTSDERLKENITTITGGLETINGLTGRTFTWKEEANMQDGTQYGLIAQEVESIVPDLVYNESGIRKFDADDNLIVEVEGAETREVLETDEFAKSVSTTGLIPVLVEAIKELSAKVTALESA